MALSAFDLVEVGMEMASTSDASARTIDPFGTLDLDGFGIGLCEPINAPLRISRCSQ